MEFWELVARESIRDRIARWNANGDAGRFPEMVAVLAPDVEFQPTPATVLHGREAVLEFLGGVPSGAAPNPSGRYVPEGGRPSLRHFTSTIQIDLLSETAARVRSYYQVVSSTGLDHWGRYLDEFAPVDGRWLITHRREITDAAFEGGWGARAAGDGDIDHLTRPLQF
jgi:SnoaL-like domain